MLPPNEIADNNLFDRAEILAADARRRYQTLWGQLRLDNAPLRVVDGGELVSASISFFDARLLSYATNDWQKIATIVGDAIFCQSLVAAQMEDHVFQAGDLFLVARVNALVEAGRLELRGESAFEMHTSTVRLPATR